MSAEQRLLAVSPNLPCAMDRQEWSLEDYHICKTLYNGYAAQVYTATCRYSGMEVVLKVYHDVDKAPDVAQHEMYREVAIQSGLQHPNVVHLFGAFEEGDTLVLVQEYVPSGDLLALMQNHGGRVDEATVVKAVLRPLLGALMYVHRWGIVHRDVKPENVLFASDGSIKLADFGLAINMVEERPISRVGTLDYMSPEVLRCPIKQSMAMTPAPGAPARYGFATDVWAMGILTFELLTGLPPYASECRFQAESRICSALPPLFPHSISPMARDFMLRALAPIPGDRPTVRQLLEHPWITNPDACLAPTRAPQLLHSYSYSQPPPQQQPAGALPTSRTSPSAPLPSPTPSHNTAAAASALPSPHPFTSGYSRSSEPQHTLAVTAAAPLSVASTAVSSPAGSGHSPAHAPLSSHISVEAATAAAAAQAGLSQPHPQPHHLHHSESPSAVAAAAALSVEQQLRSLQQQQLLDLSKLPMDQIQGMIQKLQEAMQLAVVQQQILQQQQQQQHQQQVPQQQPMRAAGTGASAVSNHNNADDGASAAAAAASSPAALSLSLAAVAAHSRCSAGATAAASYIGACDDVHMADVLRDGVEGAAAAARAAPLLVTGAYAVVSLMPTTAAAAAATSAAFSCSNSPQQQNHATPSRAAAAAAVLPDSASYTSAAPGYGSLCASRRSTVEATPPVAAVTLAESPTQVSSVRHVPSPRAVGGGVALPHSPEPHCHSPVQAASGGGAAITSSRVTCSGGGGGGSGSLGGALHEGDGLVYVSIGSSRKMAGVMAQCEGDCLRVNNGGDGGDNREAVLAAWMRQFGTP